MLMRLLETLERLRAVLAVAETIARTSEGVSLLNDKTTAPSQGLGWE